MTAALAPADDAQAARRDILVGALTAVDGRPPEVAGFRLSPGGNSHETWIADVVRSGAAERLVLRCDPDDWIRPEEMEREVTGLRIAAAVGLPAPRLIASHHDRTADRPYTVIDFAAGETIPRKIHRAPDLAPARESFAAECGAILARIRNAPRELAELLSPRDPIAELRSRYALAEPPSPVLAGAIAWLERTRPAGTPRDVVHGDFRLGNLIVGADGVRAVLDWETAHLGDPYEDLAWLCQRAWRYGGDPPVGGLGSLDDLFDAYGTASGEPVDVERFNWWLVWGATWWALVCREQSTVTRARAGDAMECAAVARLVCLQEANVLAELERYVR